MTRKKLQEIWDGAPEKEISAGCFLHKIGRKYYYVLNIWEGTRILKYKIDSSEKYKIDSSEA